MTSHTEFGNQNETVRRGASKKAFPNGVWEREMDSHAGAWEPETRKTIPVVIVFNPFLYTILVVIVFNPFLSPILVVISYFLFLYIDDKI